MLLDMLQRNISPTQYFYNLKEDIRKRFRYCGGDIILNRAYRIHLPKSLRSNFELLQRSHGFFGNSSRRAWGIIYNKCIDRTRGGEECAIDAIFMYVCVRACMYVCMYIGDIIPYSREIALR